MTLPLPEDLRAVFFDAGDTLIAPYPSFRQLFVEVALAHGESYEQADVEAAVAAAARRAAWPSDWTDPVTQRAFWTGFYRDTLGELGHPGDSDRLASALFDTFSDPVIYRVFPDVAPALAELRGRGLRLGVISNFEAWLEKVLELQRVRGYFDVLTISGVVGVAKPDPAIFRLALDGAGVAARQAVHVGDQPAVDVAGARGVGLAAVLVDRFGRFGAIPAEGKPARRTSVQEAGREPRAPVVTDLAGLVRLLSG